MATDHDTRTAPAGAPVSKIPRNRRSAAAQLPAPPPSPASALHALFERWVALNRQEVAEIDPAAPVLPSSPFPSPSERIAAIIAETPAESTADIVIKAYVLFYWLYGYDMEDGAQISQPQFDSFAHERQLLHSFRSGAARLFGILNAQTVGAQDQGSLLGTGPRRGSVTIAT